MTKKPEDLKYDLFRSHRFCPTKLHHPCKTPFSIVSTRRKRIKALKDVEMNMRYLCEALPDCRPEVQFVSPLPIAPKWNKHYKKSEWAFSAWPEWNLFFFHFI